MAQPGRAVYTIYTSPKHAPVPDHLPTLIVTPSGKPQHVLYVYLHTNYNQENYLLTPGPQGDLCITKMFPSAAITGAPVPPSSSLSSSSANSLSSRNSKDKFVRCEASRSLKWTMLNTGIQLPTYKLALPNTDPSSGQDDQPLFQVSKTNKLTPYWTLWYYTYAGHLIPPNRVEFGRIEKASDKSGGGTRVVISGQTDAERAVWRTLGEGNEDMVEWIVLCAALNVLDDEIRQAARDAGQIFRAPPPSSLIQSPRATASRSSGASPPHDMQQQPRPSSDNSLQPQLGPNGIPLRDRDRRPSAPSPLPNRLAAEPDRRPSDPTYARPPPNNGAPPPQSLRQGSLENSMQNMSLRGPSPQGNYRPPPPDAMAPPRQMSNERPLRQMSNGPMPPQQQQPSQQQQQRGPPPPDQYRRQEPLRHMSNGPMPPQQQIPLNQMQSMPGPSHHHPHGQPQQRMPDPRRGPPPPQDQSFPAQRGPMFQDRPDNFKAQSGPLPSRPMKSSNTPPQLFPPQMGGAPREQYARRPAQSQSSLERPPQGGPRSPPLPDLPQAQSFSAQQQRRPQPPMNDDSELAYNNSGEPSPELAPPPAVSKSKYQGVSLSDQPLSRRPG